MQLFKFVSNIKCQKFPWFDENIVMKVLSDDLDYELDPRSGSISPDRSNLIKQQSSAHHILSEMSM